MKTPGKEGDYRGGDLPRTTIDLPGKTNSAYPCALAFDTAGLRLAGEKA